MSGYFLVADGTRPDTLDSVRGTGAKMRSMFPGVPSALLLNKSDLSSAWKADARAIADFSEAGVRHFMTSAALGAGVEEAFLYLAEAMAAHG